MFKSSIATVGLFLFAVGTAGAATFGPQAPPQNRFIDISMRQAERDARQAIGGGGRIQNAQHSTTECGLSIWIVTLNKERFQYTVYMYASNGEVYYMTKTAR